MTSKMKILMKKSKIKLMKKNEIHLTIPQNDQIDPQITKITLKCAYWPKTYFGMDRVKNL